MLPGGLTIKARKLRVFYRIARFFASKDEPLFGMIHEENDRALIVDEENVKITTLL